jgi:hypothetical protein
VKPTYLLRTTKESQKKEQHTSDQKIGISLFDVVGLDYGQADSINNTVKKRLNINMNYQNEEGLLISQMTPTELEAYKACLGSKDSITLSFTGNAAVDDTVFLKVDYHPPESNETKLIVVSTTQGKLSGTTPDVKISGNGKTATGKSGSNMRSGCRRTASCRKGSAIF